VALVPAVSTSTDGVGQYCQRALASPARAAACCAWADWVAGCADNASVISGSRTWA
jgi:hypothetical protein